jgi:antirestriction protein ArdC
MKTTTANASLQTQTEQVKVNAYQIITDRICGMLERGTAPWTKPWKVSRGMPANLISRKPYRGINTWILHSASYEIPFWVTFKQASDAGARIKRAEKSMPVVFWKQVEVADKQTGDIVKIPFLRYYNVWNVSQLEGLKDTPAVEPTPTTPAASIYQNMINKPALRHGMAAAFYDPAQDSIGMPDLVRFATEADYYGTLYHELTHSTGHKSRLDRLTPATFGSEGYSKEELVAEMGSAFLCGVAGIERQLEHSASYIAGWLKALKADPKLVVNAAACAQKAADHILGTTKPTE